MEQCCDGAAESILAEFHTFCNKKKCVKYTSQWHDVDHLTAESTFCLDKHEDFGIETVLQVLQEINNQSASDREHVSCHVKYLHVLCKVFFQSSAFDPLMNQNEDAVKPLHCAICEYLLDMPFKLFPLLSTETNVTNKVYDENMKLNAILFTSCINFYIFWLQIGSASTPDVMQVGSPADSPNKSDQTQAESGYTELSLYVFRKTAALGLYITSAHIGRHVWTSDSSRKAADQLIHFYVKMSKHKSINCLLAGVSDQINSVVFHNGLFRRILSFFQKPFSKDSWKCDPSLKHRLIWLITKVKYPCLGEFVQKIVPCVLLLVDDYETTNKLLGISTLQYVMENVNSADLKLYNHSDVIYDALFKQLYSNKDNVFQVLLPCMLRVLMVIDNTPKTIKDVEYGPWDKVMEQMLQCMEYESKIAARRVFSTWLPEFIDLMGGSVTKHVTRILRVIYAYLEFPDGNEEQTRINALEALFGVVLNCWPVVSQYVDSILKALLKLLVDVNTSGSFVEPNARMTMEQSVKKVMLLLLSCCGEDVSSKLRDISVSKDKEFQHVLDVLKSVLDTDLQNYDFGIKCRLPFWIK